MKNHWLRFFSCLPTMKSRNNASRSNLSSDLIARNDAKNSNFSSDLIALYNADRSTDPSFDLIAKNCANWSNLPADLIALVAEHLTRDMADYLRFRAVCKAWRASTIDPRNRQHPPQLPWLIFKQSGNDICVLSLSDSRKHWIKLPNGYESASFVCDGWLVLEDSVTLRLTLWNPITSERVHFPTMSGLEGIERLVNAESAVVFRQGGQMSKKNSAIYLVSGLAISSGDVSSCVVVVCFYDSMMLARCHSRDSSWTVIDNNNHNYNDVAFVRGVLYAVTGNGDVVVYSSAFEKVAHVRAPAITGYCQIFQIVELEGKVIVLCRVRGRKPVIDDKERSPIYDTEKIHIFGLESKDNVFSLVKLNSLARKMLFAGECSRPIVVSIENYPLGKENCVYFGDKYFVRTLDNLICCTKSVVFGLEDGIKGDHLSYEIADTSVIGTYEYWYTSRWYTPRYY